MPGRTRAALAALGLLFGFAVWTALSMGWTQSAERTATELARVATYLGVFALGICLVPRRRGGPGASRQATLRMSGIPVH